LLRIGENIAQKPQKLFGFRPHPSTFKHSDSETENIEFGIDFHLDNFCNISTLAFGGYFAIVGHYKKYY